MRKEKVWIKVEIPILFKDFYDAHEEELKDYKFLQKEFVGTSITYNDINIPIYSPYLVAVLRPGKKRILHHDPLITTLDFLEAFVKGYQNGLIDFETNHKMSTNNLYSNPEPYVKKIQRLYFGENNNAFVRADKRSRGCQYSKLFYPRMASLDGMEKVGFDYGYLIEIEKLANKEKELFWSILNLKAPQEKEQSNKTDDAKIENPYPDVFLNEKAYELFENLHELNKNKTNRLVEYSFIYRKMYKEKLIKETAKPEIFRRLIRKKPFEIDLDYKLKTLDNCSPKNRVDNYILQKQLIGIE